jgi:hypothetical protein
VSSIASRFGAHLAALTSGALIVLAALSLRPTTVAWVTLGLSALTILSALAAFAMPEQGGVPRTVEILLVLGGSWTIVAARTFADPHVVKWLCFGGGVMIWALGTLGLLAHERLVVGRLRRLVEAERQRHEMVQPAKPAQLLGRVYR